MKRTKQNPRPKTSLVGELPLTEERRAFCRKWLGELIAGSGRDFRDAMTCVIHEVRAEYIGVAETPHGQHYHSGWQDALTRFAVAVDEFPVSAPEAE